MHVKKLFLMLLIIFISGCVCSTAPRLSPKTITQMNVADDAEQLILVGATSNSDALLVVYAKAGGQWQQVFTTHAYIGKNGLGKTKEGDGKTPEGGFHFTKAFGIAPDPGCALGYVQVDDSHHWIGDSSSPRYNQFVSTREDAVSAIFLHCYSNNAHTGGCVAISKQDMRYLLQIV